MQALSADIGAGRYPVGSQLPIEPALCEHYGVSRTVLREAMARLKAEGLIETRQGRGSFVLAPSARTPFRFEAPAADVTASIVELAELRLGVEGTAAALAAERRSPAQLDHLRDCLRRMADADGAGGADADLDFHRTIAEATGNGHYRLFMDYLGRFYASAIEAARQRSARSAGLPAVVQREHLAIFDAIERQSPKAAEAAMKRHVMAAARRLAAPDSP